MSIEINLIDSDERPQKAALTASGDKWLPVVRSGYRISDLIGDSTPLGSEAYSHSLPAQHQAAAAAIAGLIGAGT